jgi:hypothetical protein
MRVGLPRWLPLLLVVAALAVAGLAAAGGTGLTGGRLPPLAEELAEQPDRPAVTQAPTATAHPYQGIAEAEAPGWLSALLASFFIGLLVTVVGVFLYVGVHYLLTERVNRRAIEERAAGQPAGDEPELADEVRDAVRAGLADLDAGGDARRAVIACWLRLERVAAAAGTPRLAADTPADLVARLLAAHRVSDPALRRLADAYRLARYAPAEIGDELAATAQHALRDLAGQLGLAEAAR